MKRKTVRIACFGLALAGVAAVGWLAGGSPGGLAPDAALAHGDAERGRKVAIAADCMACHTAPDGKPFAGGLGLQTPFGTLVSSNITSDPQTGVGTWTQARFDRAVRKGQGRNGLLYPAMPYTAYAGMSDADLVDLWAFMQTLAPVRHRVDENLLPFPFDIRASMMVWNRLFFRSQRVVPVPAQPYATRPAMVDRGRYLVETLGHCGSCHTPKNMLGADIGSKALTGATLAGWHAPDLTNNMATGLGSWSEADLVSYLASGRTSRMAASGPMGEVIVQSTSRMDLDDLRAIAAYLKSLPAELPSAGGVALPAADGMEAGRSVYVARCSACHGSAGQGLTGEVPALANNPAIRAQDPASLVQVVLYGTRNGPHRANRYSPGMPGFSQQLDDGQIAAVLGYVRNRWGNAAARVEGDTVRKARHSS